MWGTLDEQIVTGHDNGDIVQWDVKTHQKVKIVSDHAKSISDMQLSADSKIDTVGSLFLFILIGSMLAGTMFISASKDTSAKLFDIDSLECHKTYSTERPVNSASISPTQDHVVLGGGQEAMDVTTTSTRIGKFDARFFHMVFEEEFGRVKGHFGPINTVVFSPDGSGYASGGEDGYVRLHTFDQSYHEYKFEF